MSIVRKREARSVCAISSIDDCVMEEEKKKKKERKKRKQSHNDISSFLYSHDWYENHSCRLYRVDSCGNILRKISATRFFTAHPRQTIIFLSTFSVYSEKKKERGGGKIANRARKHAKQSKDRVSAVTMRRWPRVYSHERTGDTRTSIRAAYFCFPINLDKVE